MPRTRVQRVGQESASLQAVVQYVLCQKGWFLAKVRDAIRMATWTRRMRRFLLNNGAASPSRPCAGKYGKISKPPRFTNLGQEPLFDHMCQLARPPNVDPVIDGTDEAITLCH